MDDDDIKKRFAFNITRGTSPSDNIWGFLYSVASDMSKHVPHERELSCAITRLEEAGFWFDAALNRSKQEKES